VATRTMCFDIQEVRILSSDCIYLNVLQLLEVSHNKELSSLCTALAGWSLKWRRNVFSFNKEINSCLDLHCVAKRYASGV